MTIYEDFVEDYNNPNITAHDVKRINNLNSREYSEIRNLAVANGDIPSTRHMNYLNAKFYSKRSDGYYVVQKQTNGKKLYVGRFASEEVAKMIVRKCIEHNWHINEIKDLIDLHKVKPKNYSLVNGYFVVQKSVNGRNKVFATINKSKVDEVTVKGIVNEFRCNDWNESAKEDIFKKFNIK